MEAIRKAGKNGQHKVKIKIVKNKFLKKRLQFCRRYFFSKNCAGFVTFSIFIAIPFWEAVEQVWRQLILWNTESKNYSLKKP